MFFVLHNRKPVTVTDAYGCVKQKTFTVEESEQLLTLGGTATPVTCTDENDGSIDLTVSGGTAPYSYNWSNSQTTQDISGLAGGSYTVTVTDAYGCVKQKTFTVEESEQLLTLGGTATPVTCTDENDGSIDLTVSGGTAPYSYNWSNSQTTQDISGLAGGSYTVTVTDAYGCVKQKTFTVEEPLKLTCDANQISQVTVFGHKDGVATVTPAGGTEPYEYLWDNGDERATTDTLSAGYHEVTVYDANGCETTCAVTIGQPGELSCDVDLILNVDCNGSANGSAKVTAIGGVGSYYYFWDNGDTRSTANTLRAGTHTVTVTDDNGAETKCEVTISEPDEVVIITPKDSSISSCLTQQEVDTEFAIWLSRVKVSGGNNLLVTNNNTGAPLACGGTVTVTWTASSECPEDVQNSAQFTVIADSEKPTFTTPSDITIAKAADCSYNASVEVTGDVTDEADNCDTDLKATYSDKMDEGDCEGKLIITRTWTLTDDCGNSTQHVQTITVQDQTSPTFNETLPTAEITAECDAVVEAVTLTAADNCDTDVPVVFTETRTDGDCANSYTLTRIWTATDDCDNETSFTQTVVVADNTAPVIVCPEDVVVSIDADDPDAIVQIPLPTVSDNCSDLTYSNDYNGTTDASDLYPIGVTTVTYTATDECGNVSSCSFTVTVLCEGQTRIDGIVYDTLTGAPLPNAVVTLIPQGQTSGDVIMQVTNSAGEYYFTNMVPGDYLVQVQDANLSAQGYYPTGSSLFFTTIADCEFQTRDFGYELSDLAVIGDFVWYDLNGNDLQDEWFDADNDDQVTLNVPDANGYVDFASWEWIDLNGDGSYSGPENEGELNKAGIYGSVTTPNIHVEGPNGFTEDIIVGLLGYWRTRPGNTEDIWGTYTASLVMDAFVQNYAQQLEATGLVKVLPESKSTIVNKSGMSTNESAYAYCGGTSGSKAAELTAGNRVDLTLDFGIRCVEIEPFKANDDILTLIYCPGGTVSGDINLFANDEGFTRENVSFNILTDLPEGVSVADGELLYVNEEANEAVITFTYSVCHTFNTENCDTAEVTIHVLLDTDCDGVPDIDDIDDDDDGILDIIEEENALDQTSLDSDGDGIVDRLDIDSDNDGIVDNIEWQSTIAEEGEYDYILPSGTDSNGDGWDDAYDPADNGITYEPWDMDIDGTPDYLDTNTDNEGEDDSIEGWDEFPNDSIADVNYMGSDADGDGLDDAYDTYNTTTEGWTRGQNAIGSDAPLQDTDEDGVRDWRDAVDDRTPPQQFACGEPVIPNAFSPNQDGYNDYFKIMIYCTGDQGGSEERVLGDDFADARIEIFNRWGNLVYEQERYGNEDYWGDVDAWWDGTSMHDMQVGKDQLPTATYFYILYFNDGNKEPVTGFIFLNN